VWPNERVVRFVNENFIPARVHVRDDAAAFKELGDRYGAHWTPTILELDPDGQERHRVEGYLDADELLAQLTLGLGHTAFQGGDAREAERRFREVVDKYPGTDAAPAALYWAGAARYRATNDASALGQTYEAISKRYPDTTWAKKASVWKK